MKKIALVALFAIAFLVVPPVGYAENPPPPLPPEEQYGNYVGPDITGTAIFEQTASGVTITFTGSCRDIQFNYSQPWPVDFFDCISPEWLLGTCSPFPCGCNGLPQQMSFPFPDDCYPQNPQGKKYFNRYPVVHQVINFTKNGGVINSKILGKWLTIIPVKK